MRIRMRIRMRMRIKMRMRVRVSDDVSLRLSPSPPHPLYKLNGHASQKILYLCSIKVSTLLHHDLSK